MRLRGKDCRSARSIRSADVSRQGRADSLLGNLVRAVQGGHGLLKDFYAKKGRPRFDIIGVCLDDDAAAAKQYLAQNDSLEAHP